MKPIVFQQISTSPHGIYGLTATGAVYQYVHAHGEYQWLPLLMQVRKD